MPRPVLPLEARSALRPVSIPGLFVTGTDTGVGKTVVAGMIAEKVSGELYFAGLTLLE